MYFHAKGYFMTPGQLGSIRRKTGLSQAKFAENIGKGERTIRRWEAGSLPVPERAARMIREFVQRMEVGK